ncbi:hypothetical protein HID58_073307, partial [Brassica napus]
AMMKIITEKQLLQRNQLQEKARNQLCSVTALKETKDSSSMSYGYEEEVLDLSTRMHIALGSAEGLVYLHNVAQPPLIYRDLKTVNILLDHGYKPKLSDFGLAKFGPSGDMSHVSTRVMGSHGYCAPEL